VVSDEPDIEPKGVFKPARELISESPSWGHNERVGRDRAHQVQGDLRFSRARGHHDDPMAGLHRCTRLFVRRRIGEDGQKGSSSERCSGWVLAPRFFSRWAGKRDRGCGGTDFIRRRAFARVDSRCDLAFGFQSRCRTPSATSSAMLDIPKGASGSEPCFPHGCS